MFDNDLYIVNRYKLFNSYSKVYIIFNKFIEYDTKLSNNVSNFKLKLIAKINDLIPNSEVLNYNDLDLLLKNLNCIDLVYPGVGNNLDLIMKHSKQNKIKINYIYREQDLIYWNHSDSGFYKFKKSFHKINEI